MDGNAISIVTIFSLKKLRIHAGKFICNITVILILFTETDQVWIDCQDDDGICVFCNKKTKKLKRVTQTLHKCTTPQVKEAIFDLLHAEQIDSSGLDNKLISYHKCCMKQLQHKVKYSPNKSVAGKRNFQYFSEAYNKTKSFVVKSIIRGNNVSTLSDVYELFTEYCMAAVSDDSEPDLSLYRCDYLLNKLKKEISSLDSSVVKKRTYLYNKSSSLSDLLRATRISSPELDDLRFAAFTIRKQILSLKSMNLNLKHINNLWKLVRKSVKFQLLC